MLRPEYESWGKRSKCPIADIRALQCEVNSMRLPLFSLGYGEAMKDFYFFYYCSLGNFFERSPSIFRAESMAIGTRCILYSSLLIACEGILATYYGLEA